MMMKDLVLMNDSMSNLTSTVSRETSLSSTTTTSMLHPQPSSSSFASPNSTTQAPSKKKRGLPGNPDPDAEVIALSPKSLLATNRFICEICNKGFQRDQNLQLHRRGHNLPWKLKQREKGVIRKKVYVCPVSTCVHHDPSRALGDLTGIKKHYCRKHGEKKWKCDKCSKKYAVQSDWKAHSKICGTREYRCDCGTLFSRRDSFITHRAFCDALTEAGKGGASSTITLPHLSQLPPHLLISINSHNPYNSLPLKREHDDQHFNFNSRSSDLPPWLAASPLPPPILPPQQSTTLDHRQHPQQAGSGQLDDHILLFQQYNQFQHEHDPSQDLGHVGPTLSSIQNPSPAHISATALLQKAVEIGMTTNSIQPHHFQNHPVQVSSHGIVMANSDNKTQPHTHVSNSMGISSSSREGDHHHHHHHHHHHNHQILQNTSSIDGVTSQEGTTQSSMLHDMMIINSLQSTTAKTSSETHASPSLDGSKCGSRDHEELTRDFLGLRRTYYDHKDFLNIAGFDQLNSSSSVAFDHHHQQLDHQNQTPWQ